jgi:hypothetical protein
VSNGWKILFKSRVRTHGLRNAAEMSFSHGAWANHAVTGGLNDAFSTAVPTRNQIPRTYWIVNSDGDVDVRRNEPVSEIRARDTVPGPHWVFGWGL